MGPHLKNESLKRKRPPQIKIPNVLKQINIDDKDEHDTLFKVSPVLNTQNGAVSGYGEGWFGVWCVKGKKKVMEDSYKVVSSIHGNPTKSYFGVYDGHGGRKAAEFVAENLHKNIIEMVENRGESVSKEEAIKQAYLKTDREFLEKAVGSGACCVTALIEGTEIVVSNLGDCRAVLCKGGVAEALTNDHRADRSDECKRIQDKGGYIEHHKGSWRVHGILAVTRSIGDAHLKDWVVAEPETKIFDVTSDMDFLILASDGLWEKVGHQEAIDIISQSRSTKIKPRLSHYNSPSSDENQKPRTQTEINDEYPCVINTSSSPKIKRVSLIKHRKPTNLSPSYMKTEFSKSPSSYFDNENETESPPSKMRRVSLFQHKSVLKMQSPNQENQKPSYWSFQGASEELVNMAVSRGSLDDITVIIVDLNHFKDRKN